MLCTVDFISRDAFKTVPPANDLAIISVGDPAEMAPRQLVAHSTWLRLEFLDCDLVEAARWGFPPEALCTTQHVELMTQFISELHESEKAWRLVVHCRSGLSRSAAVALIARALTGCDMPRFADASNANAHVLRLAKLVG